MERWGISRAELALLLGKSNNTIDTWFGKGKNTRDPPDDVQSRLDEIHTRFSEWELQEQQIPHLKEFYDLIRQRRRLEIKVRRDSAPP